MNPNTICLLIDGNLKHWQGLARLDHTQLPACVGTKVLSGIARFSLALLAVDTYRAASSQTEVRMYSAINGGEIELVEVIPSPAPDAAALLTQLGAPTSTYTYSFDERVAANLSVPPGGAIEEAIYITNGLAIAFARESSGVSVVERIRGFKPMPVENYLDNYVHFEPEAL